MIAMEMPLQCNMHVDPISHTHMLLLFGLSPKFEVCKFCTVRTHDYVMLHDIGKQVTSVCEAFAYR